MVETWHGVVSGCASARARILAGLPARRSVRTMDVSGRDSRDGISKFARDGDDANEERQLSSSAWDRARAVRGLHSRATSAREERARTSGKKQLKPSSRSGCPPRSTFTRFTTSGVSDLRDDARGGQRRLGVGGKITRERAKRQCRVRRMRADAPRVLEVPHHLEERLVHLRVARGEPRLHGSNVRERILGRLRRADRGRRHSGRPRGSRFSFSS